jgi:hypothetical protein
MPLVSGKPADPTKGLLSVHAVAGDTTIPGVSGAAACAGADGYYVEPTPGRVHLCPKTCARLLGNPAAQPIVFACR